MIRKIQRRWFEVWGDEEAQNQILKYLLLLMTVMSVVELILISVLAFKKPLIVSLTASQTKIVQFQEPDANALSHEVARCVQSYLRTRHNWDASTIEDKSKQAIQYIAPEYREKFLVSTQEQIRLAKEKQVSQKFFPEDPQIDLKTKTAVVRAERIIMVNGIRAAQGLTLELAFSLSERTEQNPEGIYITSEKLEQPN